MSTLPKQGSPLLSPSHSEILREPPWSSTAAVCSLNGLVGCLGESEALSLGQAVPPETRALAGWLGFMAQIFCAPTNEHTHLTLHTYYTHYTHAHIHTIHYTHYTLPHTPHTSHTTHYAHTPHPTPCTSHIRHHTHHAHTTHSTHTPHTTHTAHTHHIHTHTYHTHIPHTHHTYAQCLLFLHSCSTWAHGSGPLQLQAFVPLGIRSVCLLCSLLISRCAGHIAFTGPTG